MKVKVESEKADLNLSIQKTKIMASGPIISCKIDGETMETHFILGGLKITADGDCSHEIKRFLLLGRKVMINLDSILKSRDITLPTEVHRVKAIIFPVVMYQCKSWTKKKGECQRIDAFKLWCWRRPLRVPWTARRSNQSILKEINPEYSLKIDAESETPILWPLDAKNWLTGKPLMLGKIEGRRISGQQRMIWLDGIAVSRDMNLRKLRGLVKDREALHAEINGVAKNHTLLSDLIELKFGKLFWSI